MLIQRGIMKDSLDRCDGKPASGRLVYFIRYFPGHIYCGKRRVVAKGEPVSICRLPMLEPCVLLCVTIEELNLESGVVYEKDFGCRHSEIRTEKNLPYRLVSTFEFSHHDFYFPLERLPFDRSAEKGHLFAVDTDSIPDEHIIAEIMDVYSPVNFFGTSAATIAGTGVEVLQHGVITQSAYHIEPKPDSTCDKVVTCEQAVSCKNVRDVEELFLMFENRPETLCCLIVALLLHVFKIERRAASCGERHCLHRKKESGITDLCRHLCEPKNFKTMFCHAGTPRPISAKAGSLLSGFADKAMVKSNGDSVAVVSQKHAAVEAAPVELLFEVLPEAALAGVSMACHRQEIHSSVYCQYQNHCLDEETSEIFSYLSSPIERGCDNRPYLVKWLSFIHNSLIFTYKVTKNLALDQILLTLILLKIKDMNIFYSINS